VSLVCCEKVVLNFEFVVGDCECGGRVKGDGGIEACWLELCEGVLSVTPRTSQK
jgi:hypothetical protein